MKRFLLTITGLLVAAFAIAQNLDGTWMASMSMDEKKDSADVSMKFSVKAYDTITISGQSCTTTEKAVITIDAASNRENMTMRATITAKVSGTIVRDGDVLTFTPAKKAKPEVTVDVENVPGILKSLLVNPIKNEMVKELKEPDQSRIISLTADEMVLEEILTEKQVKKGEKAEQLTYHRQ